ncbi:MAG: hypothetical protein RQ751_13120, partial [Longimicrobiales bacterium]|nr:hypothetical protein [Longimicrobiales bacterium]
MCSPRRTAVRRRRPGAGIGAALLLAAGLIPALPLAAQVRVSDALSAPFHEGLTAASGADVVAWVANDRGSRNVWVARGPDFTPTRITDHRGDDGQEVGGLQLTPDGRWLLYSRGGAPNRAGWVPTPAQDPLGAERGLWWVATDGSAAPVSLGSGGSPALSPDGRRLAYTAQGRIRVRDLPGASGTAPAAGAGADAPDVPGAAELPEPVEVARPRSGAGSLVWSPDGTRLAFISSRGDHAFVGVVEVETGRYHYLDPSVDLDGSPAWSPDGTRVAFLRQPSEKDRLPFFPRPEAQPWSLRVADAATGVGVEVFRANPGPGSAFYGVSGPNLVWGADGHLVFPWEKGGWVRLWARDAP